ncbi:MAG: hypothetical protein ACKO7N_04545 [Candidatus Nitrosotenuis sp.]
MPSFPNKMFKGWCSNEGNPRSNILHYHIDTVREIDDHNGGKVIDTVETLEEYFNFDDFSDHEPFYIVSGTFKFDIPRGPIKIFETDELRSAVYIVEQLTGNKVIEDEVHNR